MSDVRRLVGLLADPSRAGQVDRHGWTGLLSTARALSLIGALADRLQAMPLPKEVRRILSDALRDHDQARTQAMWEAEMCRRALAPLGLPVILLKGTAYAAAGLAAGRGRSIGDLDILVPRDRLHDVQRALLDAGWEWVKPDAYDDLYYRQWMHELPPLIHRSRDRMIDVHHTILPPTARPTPDAAALIQSSIPLPGGLRVLGPEDMIVHSAAHLFADGDLAGGLRNLWDLDRLLREFAGSPGFWERLAARADHHELRAAVARALRLSRRLYDTPVDARLAGRRNTFDRLIEARLLARNGWGQPTRKLLRFAFYLRSHWLRMPPLLLARHLWVKARR